MGFASQPQSSASWASHFQPSQIVYLEHQTTRLYAEVVQIVEARHLCWARPLALITHAVQQVPSSHLVEHIESQIYDLRKGSDLLLPTILFRHALDTEVVPLLSKLYSLEAESEAKETIAAGRSLNQFVHQIWQAHPEIFS